MQILKWFLPFNQDSTRNKAKATSSKAKERMQSMLLHDRLELPAGKIDSLQEELVAVVSRYFELDQTITNFDLKQFERRAFLTANFMLLRSK